MTAIAIELLGRALQLVDVTLVDRRARGGDRMLAIEMRLREQVRDEASIRRAVGRLSEKARLLADLIDPLGAALYEMRDGTPALNHGAPERGPWREMSLLRMLCPDALACLYEPLVPAPDDGFDWPVVPPLADSPVTPLVAGETHESHIHLGGTLPPAYYWILLVSGTLSHQSLRRFPAAERGHDAAEAWMDAVSAAAILRMRMALIVEESVPGWFPGLPECGHRHWEDVRQFAWKDVEDARFASTVLASPRARLSRVLDLAAGIRRARRDRVLDPLRDGWALRRTSELGPSVARHVHYLAGERRLLYQVGRLLRGSRPPKGLEDDALAYLRVRNAFHQMLVHDRGADGLLRFVECFARRGFEDGRRRGKQRGRRQRRWRAQMQVLERDRMRAALYSQLVEPFGPLAPAGPAAAVRRIEVRVSPASGPFLVHTLRAWLAGIHDYLRMTSELHPAAHGVGERVVTTPPHQIGLLFHFLKRGQGAQYAHHARGRARMLARVLEAFPEFRPFVVGIDAAGAERGSSPRTFVPAFQLMQKLVDHHRGVSGESAIQLGWTFHVGEDCWDLLTGLRHIDETVRLLFGRRPGRLGHALALADAPAAFYARRAVIEQTRGERLLDLVWAHGRCAEAGQGQVCAWLIQLVDALAPGASKGVTECYRVMFAAGRDFRDESALVGMLGLDATQAAELEAVAVDRRWIELVTDLQSRLRQELARRALSIESNPTSNLYIGSYDSYGALPYDAFLEAGLPVSLNTDDPGILMTSLPHELAAMYRARMERSVHRDSLDWLAARMIDARRSTFLTSRVPGGEVAMALTRAVAARR